MGAMEEEIWIATYGTLKKGYNNYKLHLNNSTFIGKGTTQDKYPLIIKDLPYLIDEVGVGHQVEVDVFTVSQQVLGLLDEFEDHPNWYMRKEIPSISTAIRKTVGCILAGLNRLVTTSSTKSTFKNLEMFTPLPAVQQFLKKKCSKISKETGKG